MLKNKIVIMFAILIALGAGYSLYNKEIDFSTFKDIVIEQTEVIDGNLPLNDKGDANSNDNGV